MKAAPIAVPAMTTPAVRPGGASWSSSRSAASTSLTTAISQPRQRSAVAGSQPASPGNTSHATTRPAVSTRPGTAMPMREGRTFVLAMNASSFAAKSATENEGPVSNRSECGPDTSSAFVPPRSTPMADTSMSSRPLGLTNELRVGELRHVGHRLDDAGFHQQVGGFLAELRVLAGEELLVGGAVLPAQVGLALLERLASLLDVGAHDLEALLRIGLDHVDGVEVGVGEALGGLRV